MPLDPQEERQRLAELYAGKTAEELKKLADAADSFKGLNKHLAYGSIA